MLRQWPWTSQRPSSKWRSRMRSGTSSRGSDSIARSSRASSRQTAPTHVVMEACGTAHYWGRVAQGHGHTVTLLPPAVRAPVRAPQ